MKKFALSGTWLTACVRSLRQQGGGKAVGVVLAFFTLILFGDTLLPLFGHTLHVLNEVIESALEHFLEWAFHVSKRQADFIIFWGSLATALYLFWHLSRKAYHATQRLYATVQANWRAKPNSATAAWFRTMVMVGALGATLYFFT